MDKLVAPYKAVTAHAMAVALTPTATLEEVDRALAERLTYDSHPADFVPVPVLGIPGWYDANRGFVVLRRYLRVSAGTRTGVDHRRALLGSVDHRSASCSASDEQSRPALASTWRSVEPPCMDSR